VKYVCDDYQSWITALRYRDIISPSQHLLYAYRDGRNGGSADDPDSGRKGCPAGDAASCQLTKSCHGVVLWGNPETIHSQTALMPQHQDL
jgi:hypothetical protein